MRVCLTGATGFIGSKLLDTLTDMEGVEVVALSRKVSPIMDGAKKGNVTWRRCDGFNLLNVENVTQDIDVIIYLIHSMAPPTTLSQGDFSDFDLYLADNFAYAARKNNVKRIIYLSGIIPDNEKDLSQHLRSRLEVERALAGYDNRVTTLRAGIIVGKNGSSFKILDRLVTRLPIMLCPTWTLSRGQPIDLEDVLATIVYCMEHDETVGKTYDIGGPDVITYQDMLVATAKALGKKRLILHFPFFIPQLSKLWVSKISSTSKSLVYPLVDSMKHEMICNPERQLIIPGHKYMGFQESIDNGVTHGNESIMSSIINYNRNLNLSFLKNVTSMQRLENPENLHPDDLADIYFNWLPHFMKPIIKVLKVGNTVEFKLLGGGILKIRRSTERSDSHRLLFYIDGGFLARKQTLRGRLEFRKIESTKVVLVALLDFRPSLPWFVYSYTQALVHIVVMESFKKYLATTDTA